MDDCWRSKMAVMCEGTGWTLLVQYFSGSVTFLQVSDMKEGRAFLGVCGRGSIGSSVGSDRERKD